MKIQPVSREELNDIAKHPDVRKNVMTFSKKANYLGAFIENQLIGCVGWMEFSETIKLKAGFVLPEFRKRGIYTELCEKRFVLLRPKGKIMVANCTASALPYHLKAGAKIIQVYKHPSYKIKYDA
jgi:GNAT superfamily N-acetyltransferase